MADDESWLYGEEEEAPVPEETPEESETPQEETLSIPPAEEGESNPEVTEESKNGIEPMAEDPEVAPEEEDDEEEDDSDDDGFRITIDQNKIDEAKSSYSNAGSGSTAFGGVKSRSSLPEKKGKFSVEEMDQVGNINGAPAIELDMESLDEKPWKKPGADITDYFNYGFTEDTWQAYCNRQRKMRVGESGVGMPGVNNNSSSSNSIVTNKGLSTTGLPSTVMGSSINNSSSSSSNSTSINPTSFPQNNSIPTLGISVNRVPTLGPPPPVVPATPAAVAQPSSIAVMTHDKREYSKKVISEIDFSVPPPGMGGIPTVGASPAGAPSTSPNVNLPPPPIPHIPNTGDFPQEDPFDFPPSYTGYEPTMEAQWTAPPGDRDYDDRNNDWNRSRSRSSREDRRDYERKRRRSRSRSRDRYRDRRERRRSRSKSPSYKHKKSKKEKKERSSKEESSSSSKRESEDRND